MTRVWPTLPNALHNNDLADLCSRMPLRDACASMTPPLPYGTVRSWLSKGEAAAGELLDLLLEFASDAEPGSPESGDPRVADVIDTSSREWRKKGRYIRFWERVAPKAAEYAAGYRAVVDEAAKTKGKVGGVQLKAALRVLNAQCGWADRTDHRVGGIPPEEGGGPVDIRGIQFGFDAPMGIAPDTD
jgi:hypothetical protein